MIMEALRAVLGASPVPQGSWEREARFVSTAALRSAGEPPREAAERLAVRLRAVPGVRQVDVRPNGFLVVGVATPGDVLHDVLSGPPVEPPVEPPSDAGRSPGGAAAGREGPWPDFPRTWDNPGFAVRYAYVRAGAVRRWAGDLGVRSGATARPELLDDRFDRAVLRVLAELPSRRESRDPGWAAYLERLAWAYHDAFEHAPPVPRGDETPSDLHAERVRMGDAVRRVIGEGLMELGIALPSKI